MQKLGQFFSRLGKNRETAVPKPINPPGAELKLPCHLAIIMDGNGRWAQSKGLPRSAGHRAGVDALRRAIAACVELDIKVLTVYAFSTENWRRPQGEISILMNLIVEYLRREIGEMHRQSIYVHAIGDLAPLPEDARQELLRAEKITRNNTGLILNVAVNYGGRSEIVQAARSIGEEIAAGKLKTEEITEELFASHLYTSGQPDPDLLIRPSGEQRISNFLLWQLAYAEFYYTDMYWPDFNKHELEKAIAFYQTRQRRYGGLQSEPEKEK